MSALRIESLAFTPYRLPLVRAWVSAHERLQQRQGWLVTARCAGLCGYGDCAPLPQAGTETAEVAGQRLRELCACWQGQALEAALEALAAAPSTTPAADCALDSALADLDSRLAELPLRRWLSADAADRVPVNAALGGLLSVAPEALAEALNQGYRVVKLKLGVGDPDAELAHLCRLTEGLPEGMGLRLDANGAWDLKTASRVVSALNELPVESLEEPLRRPDWQALAVLQSQAQFPVALDESIATLGRRLGLERLPVRRAVLKPACHGGLRRTLALAQRLQAAGIELVVTGMIESAAGLWAATQLAAAIRSPIPQGLATADWLREDLGAAPRVEGGLLALPHSPGSGFRPHPAGDPGQ